MDMKLKSKMKPFKNITPKMFLMQFTAWCTMQPRISTLRFFKL